MGDEMFNAEFDCPGCNQIFNFTSIQKLQHVAVCKKKVDDKPAEEEFVKPSSSNQKLFNCTVCLKQMYMTNIEILKHRKSCKIKLEPVDT